MNAMMQEDIVSIVSRLSEWHELEGKTVLVTGANGFLPAYIVETILYLNETQFQKKATVIGVVRNEERARAKFVHHQSRHDLRLCVHDVCEPIEIDDHVDIVIHAASQASPKYYGSDPVGTMLPNSLGTYNLLRFASQKKSALFLFVSSAEVYGSCDASADALNERSFGSIDPTDVRSCYSEGKRFGETMCVSWQHQYRLPVKIVRPFHTYGPGMAQDDGRVHADFVANIVRGEDIAMQGAGLARRAFGYVSDVITGIFTVLFRGECAEAYNVGNARAEMSITDLADLLIGLFPEKNLKVVGRAMPEAGGYLPSSVSRCCPDTTKLEALGWSAEVSIEEGFKRTVASYA